MNRVQWICTWCGELFPDEGGRDNHMKYDCAALNYFANCKKETLAGKINDVLYGMDLDELENADFYTLILEILEDHEVE